MDSLGVRTADTCEMYREGFIVAIRKGVKLGIVALMAQLILSLFHACRI